MFFWVLRRRWLIYAAAAIFLLTSISLIAIRLNSAGIMSGSYVKEGNGKALTLAEPVEKVNTQEKVMGITINVDWGEEYIPAILAALKTREARVTFFVTGRWANKNSALLNIMKADGHQIENHGYSHPHPDQLSVARNCEEIKKTEDILMKILGHQTRYYAPPYGERGVPGLRAAESMGYKTILWTLDTVDWKPGSTPELIAQRILDPAVRFGVKPDKCGAIVLMHPKENTVQALPIILSQLNDEGFRLLTINELITFDQTGNTIR